MLRRWPLCVFRQSFCIASILILTFATQASPLSDRLGFRADEKIVILHVDDIGATRGATRAAASGFGFGLAKSGSVMMPGQAVSEVAEDLAKAQPPELFDLGVHLTLNSSGGLKFKPLSLNSKSLVNARGNFFVSLAKLAVLGKDADVEREIESQILAAISLCESAGAEPKQGECLTHIDTHMATVFLRPSWTEIYLKLAKRYKLVPMIPRWSQGLQQMLGYASTPVGWIVKPMIEKVEKRGFLPIDDLYILPFPRAEQSYDQRKAEYVNIIKNLKPGVTQIIVHPTFVDTSAPPKPTDIAKDIDAKILRDPEIAHHLRDVHLIGYREIQRIYPWENLN